MTCPARLYQGLLGHRSASMPQEIGQHPKGPGLQGDDLPSPAQLIALSIQVAVAKHKTHSAAPWGESRQRVERLTASQGYNEKIIQPLWGHYSTSAAGAVSLWDASVRPPCGFDLGLAQHMRGECDDLFCKSCPFSPHGIRTAEDIREYLAASGL